MSGKKCFMIGAKELKITWSDTPQYWKWIPLPNSRHVDLKTHPQRSQSNFLEEEVVRMENEVKAGHWKAGLIVEGIEVRPKGIST
ncbi:hypothetical protein IFM89_032491 [Coptis chinensis]|uniref:Uncharacterized protein n=1 Tax=Coptis chinensis TaxID=261450 RepID=A0A835IUM9_9MAGN|nr:hypothetical protein IFM89_032491 [Coptis chinensis]